MRTLRLRGLVFLLLFLAVLATACAAPPQSAMAEAEAPPLLDWAELKRPDSPNSWLVAPDGPASETRDAPAPVFSVPAAELARAWRAVVEAQPRSAVLSASDDGLALEAEQRSALFGFVDRISSRVVALDEGRSTLAVYSRSTVGYWDFGVNEQRVGDWLAALKDRIGAE